MSAGRHAPEAPHSPAPTVEQLRLAFRQLRHRNGCPGDFDAAMASPVWRRALHGLAVNLGRRAMADQVGAAAAAASRLGGAQPAPPTPAAPPPIAAGARRGPHLWSRPRAFDARKAAANDRDEAE